MSLEKECSLQPLYTRSRKIADGESVFLVCVTPSGDGEPARELVLNGVTGGGGGPGVEGLFIHLKSPSAEPRALGGEETSVLSPLSPIRLPPVLCSPPHAPAASIPLLPGLLLYLPLLPWFLLSPRCGWNGLELHLGLFSFSKTESDPVSPLLKVLNGLQGPAWSGASCSSLLSLCSSLTSLLAVPQTHQPHWLLSLHIILLRFIL